MAVSLLRGLLLPRLTPQCRGLAVSAGRAGRGRDQYREEQVVVTNDGTVVACWHPAPQFPRALTRPIPRSQLQTDTPASPLKVQVTEEMKELYHHKPERFQRRDLMRLTWSTKHRWFPSRRARNSAVEERRNPREKPFM